MYHSIFGDCYVVGSCVIFAFILNHAALKIFVYRSSCVNQSSVRGHEFFKSVIDDVAPSRNVVPVTLLPVVDLRSVLSVYTFKCDTSFFCSLRWTFHYTLNFNSFSYCHTKLFFSHNYWHFIFHVLWNPSLPFSFPLFSWGFFSVILFYCCFFTLIINQVFHI